MSKAILPDSFEIVVCILAQVIDTTLPETTTLNVGYKRWGIDCGPLDSFSIDGMETLSWSEEHTVVRVPHDKRLEIGDYVLIAPKHVCSTVNLWEHFTTIKQDGSVEILDCPIDARNR